MYHMNVKFVIFLYMYYLVMLYLGDLIFVIYTLVLFGDVVSGGPNIS